MKGCIVEIDPEIEAEVSKVMPGGEVVCLEAVLRTGDRHRVEYVVWRLEGQSLVRVSAASYGFQREVMPKEAQAV